MTSPFIGAHLHQCVVRRPLAGQKRRGWIVIQHLHQIAASGVQLAALDHLIPPTLVSAPRNQTSNGTTSIRDVDRLTRSHPSNQSAGMLLEFANADSPDPFA